MAVRRLDAPSVEPVDRMAVAAALDGVDDPVVLLGERVVAIGDLWRDVVRSLTGPDCGCLTVVHPSWWPRRRVDVVVRAARTVARQVASVARRDLVGREVGNTAAVVVETGADAGIAVIVVTTSSATAVFARHELDAAVGVAADWARDGPVFLDVPQDSGILADVRGAFESIRVSTVAVDAAASALASAVPAAATSRGRHRRRDRVRQGATLVAAVLMAIVAVVCIPRRADPDAPGIRWASVVEGRVGVEVPADWTVQRVTAGPGSRRVQATSPTDSAVAVHITQAYAPGGGLEDAATVLERAIAGEVRGVFVDFQPRGEPAGRPAVTYREIRTGRVVDWSVVQSGATRISIGCQSAPGREEAVRRICDQAVRSAREVTGTQ